MINYKVQKLKLQSIPNFMKILSTLAKDNQEHIAYPFHPSPPLSFPYPIPSPFPYPPWPLYPTQTPPKAAKGSDPPVVNNV